MKKILCLVLCLILVFGFTACNTTTTVDVKTVSTLKYIGDRDLKTEFEKYASWKDILSNFSNIDLSQKMGSVSGYELVTQKSDDESSSIDVYYRGEERIYEVYNGYGDNLWKYYTTALDGTKVVVSFWDENDVRNAKIELIEDIKVPYVIYFYGINKSYSLGAKEVTVEIMPENSTYAMTTIDGSYFISSASYWDANSELHKFEADYDGETKAISYHTDNIVISHNAPEKMVGQDFVIAAGLRSTGLSETAILLGKHTIFKDANDNLFVNADTTFVFNTAQDANVALSRLKQITVNANAFTVTKDSSGKYYLVNIGACTYGVSEGYENGKAALIKYALEDYDDYVYIAVKLDGNFNITSFKNSIVK